MRLATFRATRQAGHRSAEKGSNMKLRRTKLKRVTPKSQTEFTSLSLDLGGGFDRLIKTVARVIEKYFGLLYLSKSPDVLI